VHLVALLQLSAPLASAQAAVSRALGVTAFEAGQLLKGAPPFVVLRTVDAARATAALEALRPLGSAVLVDRASSVLPTRRGSSVTGMWVVALLRISGSPSAVHPTLASTLGVTAFEAGQLIKTPPPTVVLRTVDGARARAVAEVLRPLGEVALVDRDTVPSLDEMHELRGFRLEADGLISLKPNGEREVLPWAEVTHLVRAFHRVSSTHTEVTRSRKFNLGKAVLTQGLMATTEVKSEKEIETTAREPIVYLLRGAQPAWFATESRVQYEGLGPKLKPARIENFNTLVSLLRERLPATAYDERLIKQRALPADEVDLQVHLISLSAQPPA